MAFDDAYLLAASIGAVGIIVAFFLRGRPRVIKPQRQVVEPRPAEEAKPREMVLVD